MTKAADGTAGHEGAGRRGGIPRGLRDDGPAILSYGFRPFFLGAGIFAIAAMAAWVGALAWGWPVGGDLYGPIAWHGHEMVFGYAGAALAGFMLTAIPNWTGRLPVAGPKLAVLVGIWLAGRLAMAQPDALGGWGAALVDLAFPLALTAIAAREVVAGRNWKNLKIVAALAALSLFDLCFHALVLTGNDPAHALRLALAALILLIGLVGGRIVPSFTRNWLSREGAGKLPAPFGLVDRVAMVLLGVALAAWSLAPEGVVTAGLALLAAVANVHRLLRWRGWASAEEPLVAVLHVGWAGVPAGLVAIAAAALDLLSAAGALHVLTVWAVGLMTLAVMTRASLGHTGRALTASPSTSLAYLLLLLAALVRPFAEMAGGQYHTLLAVAGGAWMAAFALYCAEYGPMLMRPKVMARQPGRGRTIPT